LRLLRQAAVKARKLCGKIRGAGAALIGCGQSRFKINALTL